LGVMPGLVNLFRQRDAILVIIIVFIGLGIFNAIATWIEPILKPRNIKAEQANLIGGVIMASGIIGAIIMPIFADMLKKRKAFIVACSIGLLPGIIGLTFAKTFPMLVVSGFVLGFFLMSAGPIMFQYSTEICYPTPEATSFGIVLMAGQVSGLIFIFAMDTFRTSITGSMTPGMVMFIMLVIVSILLSTLLKESPACRETVKKR